MDDQLEVIRDNAERASDLHSLIERLEKAAGSDRELDRDIARFLEPFPTEPFKGPSAFDMHKGMYWITGKMDTKDGPKEHRWSNRAPSYTHSLDAAMTLLDPTKMTLVAFEMSWNADDPKVWPACTVRWYPPYKKHPSWHGRVSTSPHKAIAICIAALAARR